MLFCRNAKEILANYILAFFSEGFRIENYQGEDRMKVLGIYGSPRKGGNTDIALDRVLEGAASQGVDISRIYASELKITGCRDCGGCTKTGVCVNKDEMEAIYPLLIEARVIFLSSPVFFYNVTAQAKLLIDRSQALWSRRMIEKTPEERKRYDGGTGYLVMVGATKGANLFNGSELTAKYFFDALDMSYGGGLFFRAEGKGDLQKNPDDLQKAFEFGVAAIDAASGK